MSRIVSIWNAFWGAGDHAVTVPPMDGALRPNARLDDARLLAKGKDIDNAAVWNGKLVFSRGADLLSLCATGDEPKVERTFPAPISAIAAKGDKLAVALDDGQLLVGDKNIALPLQGGSVSALSYGRDGALLIAVGSTRRRASDWCLDLMERGKDGAVFRLGPTGTLETLAEGLHHAGGVAEAEDGRVLVSESWKHRIVALNTRAVVPVVWDLPCYPGRIVADTRGFWLCLFAPRSQMVEFILREPAYRKKMTEALPQQYWMAPTLRAGKNFREPVQGGGIRHLGVHKPWAPSRSYGLVVLLDAAGTPIESWHSRSDGHRHGVTSAVTWNEMTVIVCRGDGAVVAIDREEGQA